MIAAASVRDWACSFIKMLLTWFLTVNTLRLRASAISAFVRPSAISSATSASRSVNRASTPTAPVGCGEHPGDVAGERASAGGDIADCLGEAVRPDRLDEVAARAGVDRFADQVAVRERAKGEQADRLVGGAQLPDRLDSAHPGHDQIDHDDIGTQPRRCLQSLFPARRFADHLEVVERREARAHTLTQQVVVVDHEHRDRVHGQQHGEIGAVARGGVELKVGPDGLGPLAHDRQPEMARRHIVDVEAPPIVDDAQLGRQRRLGIGAAPRASTRRPMPPSAG